jgi:hypothetical protein
MPVAARAKAPDIEMLSIEERIMRRATNSTSNEVINQARSLKTGFRRRKRFFEIRRTRDKA